MGGGRTGQVVRQNGEHVRPAVAAGNAGLTGWLPALLALSVIWGASFALIKIAVDAGVAPVWVALWRCLFGVLALLGTCLLGGVRLPRDRATWLHAAVVGAVLNAVPVHAAGVRGAAGQLGAGRGVQRRQAAGHAAVRAGRHGHVRDAKVWSTAIGSLLLAEPVGWHTVLGAVLVVAGILAAR